MARVEYIVDLTAPEHAERVTCDRPARYSDERTCRLSRHGRHTTTFVASRTQLAKIRRGKGKLQITDKMIQRTR